MHELAIAQQIIETAVALLPDPDNTVTVLRIQLGALAGVSEDELRFGFEVMSCATPCANADLQIAHVPAVIHCPQCGRDYKLSATDDLLCPVCGTPAVVVVQGKALVITSLEVKPEGNTLEGSTLESDTEAEHAR
jgi:hydrogenase nickel insertion protein HypA